MNTSKIIKGAVSNGRYTVTAPIIKEDYGLYLQIEGIELPSTYEVDFSNSENSGSSVTMIGNADGVLIPRQFIDSGKDVFAFLYHVGADYGRTVYKFRIPNKVRPDRTNEEPTPEEQSTIDQTIAALNEAVAQTAQDVESADQSARSASDDADRAERAKTSSETAQGKAEEAQESAERAKDDAETSERNASESERKAKGYADTASEKADSIIGLTATATTLPEGSSATASYDAETGVMSFGIPKGKDGTDGIDGISPSVSVIDITGGHRVAITDKDGTKSFDVEDGATGATPNLTIGTVETLEPTESATATITGTPENPVLNLGIPQGEQGEVTLEDYYKAFPTDTASGSIASFPDGADNLPLKSLVVDINPIQDLHGQDAPYPAGAINIWDEEWELSGTRINSKNLIPVLPNTSYAWVSPAQPANGLRFYDASKTLLSTVYGVSNGVFTTPADCYYIWFALGSAYGTTYNHDVSINYPSTITTYYPYENICPISGWTQVDVNHSDADMTNPTTITIDLGQTVYGGKLDVLTGELVVDRAQIASYNGEALPSTWISDRDVYASGTTPTIGAQVVYKLASPITYTLTPQEITSLLGTNNLWADTGDSDVEYRADTKLYIAKKIAEAISALS